MRIEIVHDRDYGELQEKINERIVDNPNVIDVKFCLDGSRFIGIVIYKD